MGDLSKTMIEALVQYGEHGHFHGFRASTVKALQRRGILEGDALSERGKMVLSEQIGVQRPNRKVLSWRDVYSTMPTVDVGQADYEWWDRARRGQIQGYEIAGLLLKPLSSKKAAWVLGLSPLIRYENDENQTQMAKWWRDNHSRIIEGYEESSVLGDSYLVINADLSVTVLPPHVVSPIVDETDYSQIVGYRIVEVHPHPVEVGQVQQIVDEYTARQRVRTITQNGRVIKRQVFRNLIGRVPVIHIPNNVDSSSRYGHPEGEALVHWMAYYNEIFHNAFIGNRKQGRPTPVFEQMGSAADIDSFWERFGRKRQERREDGTTETVEYLEMSADDAFTLGGSGTFRWAQPGSFTADTMNLLNLLFWILVEYAEIPEFVLGIAIQGSRASTDSQLPSFTRWVEKNQNRMPWIFDLIEIVLALIALTESGVDASEKGDIKWPSLIGEDGKLTLEAIELGLRHELLDDETALSLMPLDIDDPAAVLQKLRQQIERDRERFEREDDMALIAPPDQPDDETPEEAQEMAFEIVQQAQRVLSEQEHTGVMIAFEIELPVARDLYAATRAAGIAEPVASEDMHLTLAYLGDMHDIEIAPEQLIAMVRAFAASHPPLSGEISGLGRFLNSGIDDTHVLYASFDAPDLPDFRQALVEMLEENGVPVARNHGFTPHITLAYVPADMRTPDIELDLIQLTFRQLIVAWGDERSRIELSSQAEMDVA